MLLALDGFCLSHHNYTQRALSKQCGIHSRANKRCVKCTYKIHLEQFWTRSRFGQENKTISIQLNSVFYVIHYVFTFWRQFCMSLLDATTFGIFKIYKLTFKFYLYIHLYTFIIYILIYLFIYHHIPHVIWEVRFFCYFCFVLISSSFFLSLVVIATEVSSIRNRHSQSHTRMHTNYLNFAGFLLCTTLIRDKSKHIHTFKK